MHNWEEKLILIVEDEEVNYLFLEEALNLTKVKIIRAACGSEAMELFTLTPSIDLVLLDIKLPGKNGYEVVKAMKELRPQIPVIAQTAYALAGEKEKMFCAGFNSYLSKPIKPRDLFSSIEKFFGS